MPIRSLSGSLARIEKKSIKKYRRMRRTTRLQKGHRYTRLVKKVKKGNLLLTTDQNHLYAMYRKR
jgi:hypothetical protein